MWNSIEQSFMSEAIKITFIIESINYNTYHYNREYQSNDDK